MENLLSRIKELASQRGITIAELERRTDISNSTIGRWDRHLPTADKLQRVAKVLGTSMDYLVNGEQESSEKAKILAREVNELTDEQLDLIYNMIDHFRKENKLD